MKVRTRFAPSPTGALHVGGIRTALFAWLVARQAGGQFILRIEDTDRKREQAGAEAQIINSLKSLHLDYDEGPDVGGPEAPYRQSERLDIYKSWAEKLIQAGRAYADPYTPQQLDDFRNQAKAEKRPFLFRDHRPENPPAWDGKLPLRFKSEAKPYAWHDAVMGELSAGEQVIDDFVLIKSDGYPTYNFAHIVDDSEMSISHVIRGQEFIASVPNYLNLYEALQIQPPILATMPHILAPAGNKKLSKRDGAKDVLDYIKDGYLPEALISFIATLGWNDGTTQEVFTVDELIKKFSLDRVQKSGARFDEQRLTWVNGAIIRSLPTDTLLARIDPSYWGKGASASPDYKKVILAIAQERLKYFAELPELTDFFFEAPAAETIKKLLADPPDKQLAKSDRATFRPMLEAAAADLANIDFTAENIKEHLNSLLEKLKTRPAVMFALIRIVLTGKKASPEIAGTIAVLGKDETLARLNRAIELLDA